MNYQPSHSLESLKASLSSFFQSSQSENISSGKFDLNASLYELEAYVADLKKKHCVNTKLNPLIYSTSITGSFGINNSYGPYRQADYQLPFLFFLFRHYRRNLEAKYPKTLHELIDEFIELNREKLTHHDIVITATGATRCKTNVRFALKRLRQLGLILSLDEEEDRCWAPSLFGIIIVLFLHWSYYDDHEFDLPKGNTPGEIHRLMSLLVFDPRLIYVVRQLHRMPEELIRFLNKNDFGKYFMGEKKGRLELFISAYQNLVLSNLELKYSGHGSGNERITRIRVNPKFDQISREYFKQLIDDKDFNTLYKQMLHYFSHEKFDRI